MPRLSVWFVRVALLYLGLGFTMGALMLAAPALRLPAIALRLRPFHAEILLIGWMVQSALGVAYWILPRRRLPAAQRDFLAAAALLLLNLGLLTVGLGRALEAPRLVLVLGRVAELLATLCFAGHAWPRARAYSPVRNPSSRTV